MKNIFFIFLLSLIISCGKDQETASSQVLENESISGTVRYNTGNDCCPPLDVAIIKAVTNNPPDTIIVDTLSITTVDKDGNYLFDNILPGLEDLYITLVDTRPIISATDDTPDGDEFENFPGQIWIGVFVEEDENDDGNNFVIRQEECDKSTVAGGVYSVVGQDTTSLSAQVTFNLYSTNANGDILDLIDSRSSTGFYSFNVNNEFQGVVEIDYTTGPTPLMPVAISAIDESPDNDPLTGPSITHLPVELDSCEIDSDNNFYLFFNPQIPSISGYVLLDRNDDGVGDDPISDQRIELYMRSTTNVPMTPLINSTQSDENGEFNFHDLPVGEYILYFIGDGQYNVIKGYDEDQEAGEPDNNQANFISVDIIDENIADNNNIFLLSSTTSACDAMPMIFPYPALCDTSIICTYEDLPVYVINELGEPLTTAGGIYRLEWTDLVTNQTQPGDWTYHKTNHPIQLRITYPDGCIYTVYYHRECEQDLTGSFSMNLMTTGFGPTYNYTEGEVEWHFEPFGKTVLIEHEIINGTSNPNLVPEGTYSYNLTDVGGILRLTLNNPQNGMTYELGQVRFQSGQIVLDDNIAADGIGRYFSKNE